MFIISEFPNCGFGNKLIYINNLIQISHFFGQEYSFPTDGFSDIFELNTSKNIIQSNYNEQLGKITKSDLYDKNVNYFLPFCLGDYFFVFDELDTTEIFKFNKNIIPTQTEKYISIHFRGNDFFNWDSNSILDFNYYEQSINYFISEGYDCFRVFTDDKNLLAYNKVIEYLTENNINYKIGESNNFLKDFVEISYSDGIISSPSTFCISAGFCGKKDKKIIHSKFWVDYQCEKKDGFWQTFNDGGNRNYNKFKLI